MTRTIIVEDEAHSIVYLKSLLIQYCPEVQVLGVATTVEEAVQLIHDTKPELVLMDVELCGKLSFQIFEKMPSPPHFEVIFITGHENYAIQAIKYSCLDYLLKPIDGQELATAIEKFNMKKKVFITHKQIELLLQNTSGSTERLSKIAVSINDGLIILNIADIIYCKGDGNYTWIYTIQGEKTLSYRNLQYFEDLLSQEIFFRCHKSSVINLNHVKKYSKTDGYKVYLTGGHWVDVSVRKRDEFLTKILAV